MNKQKIKDEWAKRFYTWWQKPQVFVREVFGVTPDAWQDQVLEQFPHNPRIAMKASKGPGKTCVEAWLAWNFLLTRPHPNIAATSISADNLRDNLWKEMAVWRNKSPLLQQMFEWQKERIFAKDHPETWFMSARSWAKSANDEELGLTMAGLHSEYVMAILDESGGMPVQILQAAEGVLSSAKEGHIIQAGNTNTLDGALYYACVKRANLWKVIVINGDPDNPLRSPRIKLDWAQDLIRTEGRDSPFVKVMLLGEWPSASLNALIGPEEIEEAMKRCYREFQYGHAPKIIGVDVARQGDDASVMFKRQGLVAFPPIQMRNFDSNQGAGKVIREWNDWQADACFVDATGGFGAGWIDAMALLGRSAIGVQYAGKAHNSMRYVNKRCEMYFDLVKWIKEGGQLPPCPELLAALPATLYTFQGDRLLLEPKEVIKAKIGYSPDHADALCFEAGTMIATPAGSTAIEQIKLGDVVLTPFGRATVRRLWQSETSKLTTAQFSNGAELTGRPEHDVFVFNKGACPLDALTPTMVVSSLRDRWKWLLASALFIEAKRIGFKILVGTLAPANLSTASACCIGAYGPSGTVQYRTGARYTIAMVTGAIVQSIISKFSNPVSTPKNIMLLAASTAALRGSINWPAIRLPSGTAHLRVWPGIQNTGKKLGKGEIKLAPYARAADHLSGLSSQQEPNFVQSVAKKQKNIFGAKQIFEHAIGAVPHLWRIVAGNKPVAPVSAATRNVPPTTVYNLTLDRDNAYYANGVLVFNCQTFAEPVAPRQVQQTKNTRHKVDYNPFEKAFEVEQGP